ncbi:hypothetical protein LTR99_000928 [Exophiala xenobiotica]|uniref:Uncharacterized protein n=1 Tax=Vermiconidia calcicola TaxID=1690605 RepID=A0AAV9QJZ7_9PEZI|nr:hypothetical protein LTR96_003740 [Exophiala xenobiotica]KAK5540728.1 hypothetical protein LTR23_005959 [Chaetothyriales sp. CCFEE 6169]KAK5545491.1 hypothetical protein LTR25_000498 [Vermiconidia calcicola]KAK5307956.1 hypothetical protein LTR99_000928 [Exophiala xenobiotica]KAK5331536.1 hypothetical protein LTR93_000539 [Exophiala xenobiotica]
MFNLKAEDWNIAWYGRVTAPSPGMPFSYVCAFATRPYDKEKGCYTEKPPVKAQSWKRLENQQFDLDLTDPNWESTYEDLRDQVKRYYVPGDLDQTGKDEYKTAERNVLLKLLREAGAILMTSHTARSSLIEEAMEDYASLLPKSLWLSTSKIVIRPNCYQTARKFYVAQSWTTNSHHRDSWQTVQAMSDTSQSSARVTVAVGVKSTSQAAPSTCRKRAASPREQDVPPSKRRKTSLSANIKNRDNIVKAMVDYFTTGRQYCDTYHTIQHVPLALSWTRLPMNEMTT